MDASPHSQATQSPTALQHLFAAPLALTYDDVLLLPQYSTVLPHQAELTTQLAAAVLPLPLLAAAMDTVTEAPMAEAMARAGGMGVIHKNMAIEAQADAVAAVKAVDTSDISGIAGALGAVGTSAPSDASGAAQTTASEKAARDPAGRLLVAAATGVGEAGLRRAEALVQAGADFVVVDTAHGHSAGVVAQVQTLRARFPQLQIVAGNVATAAAVAALVQAGADVVKVGIGPGSICTTRTVSGVGVPQLSAVAECAQAAAALRAQGRSVHVIADGGIKASGDVVKALAVGADAVMVGSLLAGADEAPGTPVTIDGVQRRTYRGMGSPAAMRAGSADRYFQGSAVGGSRKLVAEGIAATVAATGPAADTLHGLQGGLRAGMGYVGARDLAALRARARFVRQSGAGLLESRVHGVLPAAD